MRVSSAIYGTECQELMLYLTPSSIIFRLELIPPSELEEA